MEPPGSGRGSPAPLPLPTKIHLPTSYSTKLFYMNYLVLIYLCAKISTSIPIATFTLFDLISSLYLPISTLKTIHMIYLVLIFYVLKYLPLFYRYNYLISNI